MGKSRNSSVNESVEEELSKKRPKRSRSKRNRGRTLSDIRTSGNNTFESEIREVVTKYLHLDLQKFEVNFLKEFFTAMPGLHDIWDRIGFNEETKQHRLSEFYDKVKDLYEEIIESELDLEEDILKEIEEKLKKLKLVCLELHVECTEAMQGTKLSKIDQDELLKSELAKLEAEKSRRVEEASLLLTKERELCEKLDFKRSVLPVVPSESEMNQLKNRIKELEKIRAERMREIASMRETIDFYMHELDLSHSDSFGEMIIFESADTLPLSENHIKRAHKLCEDLKHQDIELSGDIRTMRAKIIELWQKLNIENPEVSPIIVEKNGKSVLKDYNMSKRTIFDKLSEELERCIQIKMENMQKFIESVRAEIREYCSRLYLSKAELKELNDELLHSADYTEELLNLHEAKLEDMKFRYTENQALYEKTAKWIDLWEEFIKFEEKTKDPNRFKIRGYNMLEEEKSRKAFNSQLPKLEEDIYRLAGEYEQMNGGVEFAVHGLNVAEFVARKKCDYEESKNAEKKEKQILRENMKRNESRFGSKPMTPLALRTKRKAPGGHDTHMQTPSKHSKLQKTDLMASQMPTPGSQLLMPKPSAGKSTVVGSSLAKSKMTTAAKRKSRTPGGKSRARRSRGLALTANDNQSKMSNNDLDPDATMKSTASTATTGSMFSTMTSNSTTMSSMNTYSNWHHNGSTASTGSTGASKLLAPKLSASKCPPLSSSSKYSSQSALKGYTNMQRMTSTASNTFIEEENLENIEPITRCTRQTEQKAHDAAHVVSAAAHKISKLVSTSSNASRFGFQFQSSAIDQNKLSNFDVNYSEFSVS